LPYIMCVLFFRETERSSASDQRLGTLQNSLP